MTGGQVSDYIGAAGMLDGLPERNGITPCIPRSQIPDRTRSS